MTEYLTTAQHAERYGIDVQTVRRMCERGELPAKKIGSVWRIADDPPGGRASGVEAELAEMRREIAALREWKESVCTVFSGATAR